MGHAYDRHRGFARWAHSCEIAGEGWLRCGRCTIVCPDDASGCVFGAFRIQTSAGTSRLHWGLAVPLSFGAAIMMAAPGPGIRRSASVSIGPLTSWQPQIHAGIMWAFSLNPQLPRILTPALTGRAADCLGIVASRGSARIRGLQLSWVHNRYECCD